MRKRTAPRSDGICNNLMCSRRQNRVRKKLKNEKSKQKPKMRSEGVRISHNERAGNSVGWRETPNSSSNMCVRACVLVFECVKQVSLCVTIRLHVKERKASFFNRVLHCLSLSRYHIRVRIEYLRLLTINLGKKSSALGTHNM
jgi:hypothetical protein